MVTTPILCTLCACVPWNLRKKLRTCPLGGLPRFAVGSKFWTHPDVIDRPGEDP